MSFSFLTVFLLIISSYFVVADNPISPNGDISTRVIGRLYDVSTSQTNYGTLNPSKQPQIYLNLRPKDFTNGVNPLDLYTISLKISTPDKNGIMNEVTDYNVLDYFTPTLGGDKNNYYIKLNQKIPTEQIPFFGFYSSSSKNFVYRFDINLKLPKIDKADEFETYAITRDVEVSLNAPLIVLNKDYGTDYNTKKVEDIIDKLNAVSTENTQGRFYLLKVLDKETKFIPTDQHVFAPNLLDKDSGQVNMPTDLRVYFTNGVSYFIDFVLKNAGTDYASSHNMLSLVKKDIQMYGKFTDDYQAANTKDVLASKGQDNEVTVNRNKVIADFNKDLQSKKDDVKSYYGLTEVSKLDESFDVGRENTYIPGLKVKANLGLTNNSQTSFNVIFPWKSGDNIQAIDLTALGTFSVSGNSKQYTGEAYAVGFSSSNREKATGFGVSVLYNSQDKKTFFLVSMSLGYFNAGRIHAGVSLTASAATGVNGNGPIGFDLKYGLPLSLYLGSNWRLKTEVAGNVANAFNTLSGLCAITKTTSTGDELTLDISHESSNYLQFKNGDAIELALFSPDFSSAFGCGASLRLFVPANQLLKPEIGAGVKIIIR